MQENESSRDHDIDADALLTHETSSREQLVAARRARQKSSGGSSGRARLMLGGGLLAAGVVVIFSFAGPAAAVRFFVGESAGQKASQISLKVDNPTEERSPLDFSVPAAPVKEDTALSDTIKALQAQIAQMERDRKPGMSTAEVQEMLSRYDETVKQQMARERQKMADENARLQKQALEADEARRRADEAARLREGTEKERQEREKQQRESDAVIVDDAEGPVVFEQGALAEERDPNRRFLRATASSVVQTAMAQRLPDPSRMVVQGTIISAVLETAVDTELPGNLRAQVTEPVYSFDGKRVLMPEGTILIGEFNNDVAIAQKRVMIAWNRAVTPDGQSVALGSLGTDRLGRSGTVGNVDNRYGTKFGAAALISAITALPTMLASQSEGGSGRSGSAGTTVNINGGSQIASDVGSSFGDQANQALAQYLSLGPVIRIPQGEEIRIFVNRDLVFK